MSDVSSVAVIPARGGSQRVPGKNLRPLDGVPTIVRVIALCQSSGACDRIIVSTDNAEIASSAKQAGAEVPFIRPPELADDHTGILPVMQHAVTELALHDASPVACVYATAVTMDPHDLSMAQQAISLQPTSPFVISITTYDAPIQRALTMNADGVLAMVDPATSHTRSQDLPDRWHDAGQFIWATAEQWRIASSVWDASRGYPVPHWRCVDIDTEEDWRRAELTVRTINADTTDR